MDHNNADAVIEGWDAPMPKEDGYRYYTIATRSPKLLGGYKYYRYFYVEGISTTYRADAKYVIPTPAWKLVSSHTVDEEDYNKGKGVLNPNSKYSWKLTLRSNSKVWWSKYEVDPTIDD